METRTFRLIGLDEGGVRKSRENDNLRLVCLIDGGGKLAVWGHEVARENIDKVRLAGMPCTVECEWIVPEEWALKYGHTHWVPQGAALSIKSG